jgi:geranylgeranyl diphosphate synthase, type I
MLHYALMAFKKFLEKEARLINIELDKVLNNELRKINNINPKLKGLFALFFNAVSGGKRIRGTLVTLGFNLASGKNETQIYKIASAFEIFQTAILIHDDIIDQSNLRRGRKSLHMEIGGGHYGLSQALCLGDFGFFLASQIITQSGFDEKLKNQALLFFNKVVLSTTLGEILDVKHPFEKNYTNPKDSLLISELKTAEYSFVGPLAIGALLGGADSKIIYYFEEFGKNLGIAFQIKDDLLGLFGAQKKTGKSSQSDASEGKMTILISFALSKANSKQKAILKELYGKKDLTQKELEIIKKIFIETRAVEYAESKVLEYINSSRKIIPKITQHKENQMILEGIADYLLNREN